jgi:hypothetical protein
MVENVQKVMKMADTVRPLVQQYGPMVKNLPSMLQLLKEYQSYSSDSNRDEKDTSKSKTSEKTQSKKKTSPAKSHKKSSTSTSGKSSTNVEPAITNKKEKTSSTNKRTKSEHTFKQESVPFVKQLKSSPSSTRSSSVPKLYI